MFLLSANIIPLTKWLTEKYPWQNLVSGLLSYRAESGVLSVLPLLPSLPGVEVLRGALDPNPTGVGRMPRAPDLMLEDRRTLEPRRPWSSSELRDMLEP